MKRNRLGRCLSALLMSLLAASAAGQPVGSAFTYQGRLADTGFPATANYDFHFRLFDQPALGTQLAFHEILNVPVTSGLFTVSLDFGTTHFAGSMRWLEVGIKPAGGPTYTMLSPRQVLAPTPYAIFSSNLAGTYGDPVTFSNPANVFAGDGSGLTNLNAQALFKSTRLVSPVGSPAANGAALLAALAAIPAPSASNPWLLKIEPGVYELPAPAGLTSSLLMREYVDIEGSGESVTTITSPGSGSNDAGTVQAVNNSGLRFVTVENTGGAAYAKPLFVRNASPRISHVTAIGRDATTETQGYFADMNATPTVTDLTVRATASIGYSFGVLNVGAHSVMSNVHSTATGGAFAQAVWNCCNANPTLRNLTALATGGTTNIGVTNTLTTSPTLENVVAVANGSLGSNIGIGSYNPSAPIMRSVACRASGAGATDNIGCYVAANSQPTMTDVLAEAVGGGFARAVQIDFAVADVSLTRVRAKASDGTIITRGVYVNGCSPSGCAFPIAELDATAVGSVGSEVTGLYITDASPHLSDVRAGATSNGMAPSRAVVVTGSSPTSPILSNLVAAASANGGGEVAGIAIMNSSPSLHHATALATSTGTGNSRAVVVTGLLAAPTLTNLVATGSGGGLVAGIDIVDGSPSVNHAKATALATGVSSSNGVSVSGSSAAPRLSDVVASGSGGVTAIGMLTDSARPVLSNVVSSGLGGASLSLGLFNMNAPQLAGNNVEATASGAPENYAVYNRLGGVLTLTNAKLLASGGNKAFGMVNTDSAGTVTIERSTISGSGAAANASVQNDVASSVSIATSQLVGIFNNPGAGLISCLYSYNGGFAPVSNLTCN